MKLTQYENPFSGKKENIFDLGGMFSKILGIVVMFFVIATGQNIAKTVSNKTKLDTTIEPLVTRPVTPTFAKRIY